MITRKSRQRPDLSLGAWSVTVLCLAVGAAWKFGWLPIELGEAHTGRLAETPPVPAAQPYDVAPPAGQPTSAETPIEVDPIVFSGQSEPPPDSTGDFAGQLLERNQPRRQRLSAGRPEGRWDTGSETTMPAQFPAVTDARPVADRSGSNPPRTRAVIAQVSNEVGQPALDEPAQNRPAEARPAAEPVRPAADGPDLQRIDQLLQAGKEIAAHRELSKIYWQHPEWRPVIMSRMESTARSIYFSPQPHYMEPYEIQPGDQLRKIAKAYNVSWEYLAALNRIDPRRIRPGQKLKVIKGPFSAFVDLSDFELTIHAHGYFVKRYRVGIGKDGASPIGRFQVLNKVANPQYTDPKGRVIDSDDPENPLGEHWIDIGDSFGIHGTIDPDSIGRSESRGCIRMLNEDVAEVYNFLEVGSEVVIRR